MNQDRIVDIKRIAAVMGNRAEKTRIIRRPLPEKDNIRQTAIAINKLTDDMANKYISNPDPTWSDCRYI
jgi:hypothetical protein